MATLNLELQDIPELVSPTNVTRNQPLSAVRGDGLLKRWKRKAWGDGGLGITQGHAGSKRKTQDKLTNSAHGGGKRTRRAALEVGEVENQMAEVGK
jgi:hypothetical protein